MCIFVARRSPTPPLELNLGGAVDETREGFENLKA
jgi:hypothetical protein